MKFLNFMPRARKILAGAMSTCAQAALRPRKTVTSLNDASGRWRDGPAHLEDV